MSDEEPRRYVGRVTAQGQLVGPLVAEDAEHEPPPPPRRPQRTHTGDGRQIVRTRSELITPQLRDQASVAGEIPEKLPSTADQSLHSSIIAQAAPLYLAIDATTASGTKIAAGTPVQLLYVKNDHAAHVRAADGNEFVISTEHLLLEPPSEYGPTPEQQQVTLPRDPERETAAPLPSDVTELNPFAFIAPLEENRTLTPDELVAFYEGFGASVDKKALLETWTARTHDTFGFVPEPDAGESPADYLLRLRHLLLAYAPKAASIRRRSKIAQLMSRSMSWPQPAAPAPVVEAVTPAEPIVLPRHGELDLPSLVRSIIAPQISELTSALQVLQSNLHDLRQMLMGQQATAPLAAEVPDLPAPPPQISAALYDPPCAPVLPEPEPAP